MYHLHLIAAVAFSAGAALADPATEMRALGNCENCSLSSGDFTGHQLMGVDLSKASISDVSFANANMTIGVFDGANFSNVSFAGTNLRGATFVNASLSNVDFKGADLTGAVFEGAGADRNRSDCGATLQNTNA